MSREYIVLMAFCLTVSLLVIFSPKYKLEYKFNKI